MRRKKTKRIMEMEQELQRYEQYRGQLVLKRWDLNGWLNHNADIVVNGQTIIKLDKEDNEMLVQELNKTIDHHIKQLKEELKKF